MDNCVKLFTAEEFCGPTKQGIRKCFFLIKRAFTSSQRVELFATNDKLNEAFKTSEMKPFEQKNALKNAYLEVYKKKKCGPACQLHQNQIRTDKEKLPPIRAFKKKQTEINANESEEDYFQLSQKYLGLDFPFNISLSLCSGGSDEETEQAMEMLRDIRQIAEKLYPQEGGKAHLVTA